MARKERKESEEKKEEKSAAAKREEAILAFWNERDIFKKSEEKEAPQGEFVFYDGPPFATGLPHYGHILAGTIKDAIPRYKTMRGFRVRRRWGWDCHGLPLENQIEDELGIKTKKDIETMGIGRFNAAARERVLRYADDWKRIVPRMGRWVDMEHDYKTMDASYTESVWFAFKSLFDKGLLYEGFKAMHLCPRCGTTLSNFEVSQGYKEITDIAMVVKFELQDEPGVSLLAWTTTPWTLPGNMALAVNAEAIYALVETEGGRVIIAKKCLAMIAGEKNIVKEFPGRELVLKQYRPVFDYYAHAPFAKKKEVWSVYAADFVTLDEGTGIVHIAPAFGEDDLALAQREGIPVVHHVGMDGRMVSEVRELSGMQAKPKDDHQRTDIEILKLLTKKNLLFKKEKITHSYPHCWRCDTPLLNYAAGSWFVRVTAFKDKLIAENEKVHWVPEAIKEGRFGNWLKGARDWAISRSRYWGAPIPAWRAPSGELTIIGSLEELKAHTARSGNRYFLLRHGEGENNATNVISGRANAPHHLTLRGKEESHAAALRLLGERIDYIFISPFVRTQETAQIVAEALGIKAERVIVEERLREINLGEFEGRSPGEYHAAYETIEEKFVRAPKGGETIQHVKERTGALLYELENRYRGARILFVTHEYPAWLMTAAALGANVAGTIALKNDVANFDATGTLRELAFTPLPHNEAFELDLHRPYIDALPLQDAEGNALTRVSEVFDCWFESGSMPYASAHYPFARVSAFEPMGGLFKKTRGFPADFVAEGLDQTRGWFYSLLVLSTALFGRAPYRNVIVNGIILGGDGQKLSKRLKNYSDVTELFDRYGADALRHYLLASPLMRGENLVFSEAGVDEVSKKLIGRLDNVRAFYELYQGGGAGEEKKSLVSEQALDRWIVARLDELVGEVTAGMENYELDRAVRPIMLFIDDLSTWYLRRSRERFKGHHTDDAAAARATLRFVLRELAKVIAPFMPFFAETLFQSVREARDPESVHLVAWPEVLRVSALDEALLERMAEVRAIVSRALQARAAAGIKVRQPLSRLTLRASTLALQPSLIELIKEEVNVKEVMFADTGESELMLATELTDELREEGVVREVIRAVQDFRKREGLAPRDLVALVVSSDEYGNALVSRFSSVIKEAVNASEISFGDAVGEELIIDGHRFTFAFGT